MKTLATLLILALPLVAASGAEAGVSLGASCPDGTMHVAFGVFNDGSYEDAVGIVVVRSWVGACGLETIVSPAPFPIPAFWTEAGTSFDDAVPATGKYFQYRAYALLEGGGLRPAPGQGDPLPYAYAACGEAVAARGYLLEDSGSPPGGYVRFEPCLDDCWFLEFGWYPVYLDLSALDPAIYAPYVGQPVAVDVYGRIYVDGMPGASGLYDITRVEPSPDGACGPIPARTTSWGSLKNRYR
jgi:hypothetical protein